VGVQAEARRIVSVSEDANGIGGHRRRRRHFGQESAIRAAEPNLTIRLSLHLEPLFMYGAVVAAAQEREVGQRGGAALGPVPDVVALPKGHAAAREAAAAIAVVQRRNAGGMVRVRAPTSTTRPSASCRITTRLASHASR
jgi:hypothetical protein